MKTIKCVIWDLDQTLWNGILLEDKQVELKEGIKEIIETLDKRGILQSIASRNNYDETMEKLKEFGIAEYFLYPQINWQPKSVSVKQIKEKLNIGMDTILFIDDQQFELDEVKSVHSEVVTIEASEYKQLLLMDILNPPVITVDSSRRRKMYLEQQQRYLVEEKFEGTPTEFFRSLNMVFKIERAKEEDLQRAEELTVRTNQLNSTGVQYSYDDLKELMNSDKHRLWVCELVDKYGSYGKIGLALEEVQEDVNLIKLLLMSCRTISRGVGSVLLSFLMKEAKEENKKLQAYFKRTDRNRQMLITYQLANFTQKEKNEDIILYENDLTNIQDYPDYIQVIINR